MPPSKHPRTIAELQRLEEEAWDSPPKRSLYATRHIPGFPWHTVQEVSPRREAAAADAAAIFPSSVRRHVIPYDFSFRVFVKGRWVGRRLLEVYAEELPHHTPAYYEASLRQGRLYCVQRSALGHHNTQRRLLKRSAALSSPTGSTGSVGGNTSGQPWPLHMTTASSLDHGQRFEGNHLDTTPALLRKGEDVVLQHGDVVYHTVHRHEMPVTVGMSGADAVMITAVHISSYGLICVNKPTGLPTHATGRYNYNSLTALLEYVLAPRRLASWILDEDPLLQSLVSTDLLSPAEKSELYNYYSSSAAHTSSPGSAPQSSDLHRSNEAGTAPCSVSSLPTHATTNDLSTFGSTDLDEVNPDKAPRACHRLDKVTSGVLLLAVHRDAAKRIGAVLMRKAKEVEEAVTKQLSRRGMAPIDSLTRDGTTGPSTAGVITPDCDAALCALSASRASPPESLQRVLAGTYELQKYYLARVCVKSTASRHTSREKEGAKTGLQHTLQQLPMTAPPSSPLSTASQHIWHVSGDARYVRAHNKHVSRMLSSSGVISDSALLRASKDKESTSTLPGVLPSGVLMTSPVPMAGTIASAASATLVQFLSPLPTITAGASACSSPQSGTSVGAVDDESVVLCTPYTGRLHQIRVHLSSLGYPIVGDVVYARSSDNEDAAYSLNEAQTHLLKSDPAKTEGVACPRAVSFTRDKMERGVSAEVHCAAQLAKQKCDFLFYDDALLPAAYHRFREAAKGGFRVATPPGPSSLPETEEALAVKAGSDDELHISNDAKRSRTEGGKSVARESGVAEDTISFPRQVTPCATKTNAAVTGGTGAADEHRNGELPPRWQDEPLCYECAGLLPIVAAGECATGTSAICLHAWVYQLKKSLLFTNESSAETNTGLTMSGSDVVAMPSTSNPSPSASSSVSLQVNERDSAVGENEFVCFEAPPPSWLWGE